jgi:hypothetical protein
MRSNFLAVIEPATVGKVGGDPDRVGLDFWTRPDHPLAVARNGS